MKLIVLCFASIISMWAQPTPPEAKPAFEIASVKPTATTDGSFTYDFPPGGRFTGRNVSLKTLLRIAYGLEDYQIAGGPGWLTSAGFDIQARAEMGPELPRGQVLKMIQTLVEDRFRLAAHRETRQLPIYELSVSKGGHKLQTAQGDTGRPVMRMGQLKVQKMSMVSLAGILAFDVKRPVKDTTGLAGDFAFSLEWTPGLGGANAEESSARPSLFTALQEQLGLKLEAARGPVEILVIDSAEKASGN